MAGSVFHRGCVVGVYENQTQTAQRSDDCGQRIVRLITDVEREQEKRKKKE